MSSAVTLHFLRHCRSLLSAFLVLVGTAHGADPGRPPQIDLPRTAENWIMVDREPGQYLGHPTTVLLQGGKTLLCVYPKGHGKGPIQLQRSTDGGKTWSGRLPVPEN
ncbi:MAG: hypothetical protein FJ379_11155 [Verrucomicrobia bacterium]|nr:hypothetical protein [Verrucomicrobiota bacterium]